MSGLTDATPALFEETIAMRGTFTASAARVAELLPDPRLHPLQLWPGRSLVTLVALEHRLCDFGPFCELSIVAHVRFGPRPLPAVAALAQLARLSFQVHPLEVMVTGRSVRTALAERYGLPARLADVAFREDGVRRECSVTDRGAQVLTLGCTGRGGGRPRRIEVTLYAKRQGRLASALLETTQYAPGVTLRRDAARLELAGDHPLARRLASLDLDPRPAAVSLTAAGQAILHRPTAVEREDGRRAA